jgi:hypothetical protein
VTTTTMVNGFPCKDCTDIDYAKKHIDPAHPKDGPYGVNAASNPEHALDRRKEPAFRLDGKVLAGFGAFARHLSYFPHSGKVLPVLADKLTDYDWSTGTLRFAIDQPLPSELVAELVRVRRSQAFDL